MLGGLLNVVGTLPPLQDATAGIVSSGSPPADGGMAALYNLAAALIGAVVGALATGKVTRGLARSARAEEQREEDEVNSFALQQKLIRIYSSTFDLMMHFRKARQQQLKLQSDPSIRSAHIGILFRPFANFTSDQEFTISELYTLNRIGRHKLLNTFVGIDHQHNGLNQALRVFGHRRDQLMDPWTGTPGPDGTVFRAISDEKYAENEHRFIELDHLVGQLEELAADLLDNCILATTALTHAQGVYFEQEISVTLSRIDDEPITIKSTDAMADQRPARPWFHLRKKARKR